MEWNLDEQNPDLRDIFINTPITNNSIDIQKGGKPPPTPDSVPNGELSETAVLHVAQSRPPRHLHQPLPSRFPYCKYPQKKEHQSPTPPELPGLNITEEIKILIRTNQHRLGRRLFLLSLILSLILPPIRILPLSSIITTTAPLLRRWLLLLLLTRGAIKRSVGCRERRTLALFYSYVSPI